jgi:hypothetical protein
MDNFVDMDALAAARSIRSSRCIYDALLESEVVYPIADIVKPHVRGPCDMVEISTGVSACAPAAQGGAARADVLGYGPIVEDSTGPHLLQWGPANA